MVQDKGEEILGYLRKNWGESKVTESCEVQIGERCEGGEILGREGEKKIMGM